MGELVSAAMSLGPAAVILVVLAVFVLPLASGFCVNTSAA